MTGAQARPGVRMLAPGPWAWSDTRTAPKRAKLIACEPNAA